MPKLWRDVALFAADFSSEMNHWTHRGLFQHQDGTITKALWLTGIDEMRESLRQLENGTLRVVRKTDRSLSSSTYDRLEHKEEIVKKALREKISSLENNYSYYEGDEEGIRSVEVVGSARYQH